MNSARQESNLRPQRGPVSHAWRGARPAVLFSGDLFSCQGAISARRTSHLAKSGRRTRRARSRTPSSAGVEAAELAVPAPVSCVVFVGPDPEIKKAAPFSEAAQTVKDP
jgi:hypothetical protein